MDKVLIERAGITMETFILIVLFYLFLAFVSFVIVYANDTADIANNDFETYEPSVSDLSEEERTSIYTIDNYIKSTICPRYHHQILKNEINHYQKDNMVAQIALWFIVPFWSNITLKILDIERWWTLHFVVTLVIGILCYFVVWLLYNKYSSYRIKDYHEIHSSYDWESHYDYLCSIKKNVIFRYMLRNTIGWLAILCFFIVATYYNI